MTLIKSISGIRGTIGGEPGENLTPTDLVKFTSAFAEWVKRNSKNNEYNVILGRDARTSGKMVDSIVSGTLMGMGINVFNLGLASTPTVEIAVTEENADGGIILTASHNPGQWNALKLLNSKGEFLSASDGEEVLRIADAEEYTFAEVDKVGSEIEAEYYDEKHIQKILALPMVDVNAIRRADFKVAVDCVNSVGGNIIPKLLRSLGVENIVELYCEPNGIFPHNPEPLPEHLVDLSDAVKLEKADLGFTVDPDVDRLAIVTETGEMFGEEYTLVAVADYILESKKGSTVSNLSSSRALRDITIAAGCEYFTAAVGEVNVVAKMKEVNAVIGGEGNGGVIYPELHYGRDALVGIALFLTHLAKKGVKCSELRNSYPEYTISKNKIQLQPGMNVDSILERVKEKYASEEVITIDGVKIEFEEGWVHLRKSNTEPIVRVYSESKSEKAANELAGKIIDDVKNIAGI